MSKIAASFYSLLFLILVSCNNQTADAPVESKADADSFATENGHPSWILQGNIYEVNTRQYTPEGTFKAFSQHLQRLKDMGVQTLWFMPIQPISKQDRKGELGSYYAIANYTAINPEYGTIDDWKILVNRAHEMDMKVIIDWVPNHTGGDHSWLTSHPDYYVKDSVTGKPISPFDWSDVKKLDYKNPAVSDSMLAAMKFWITETGIDGFRCDVAASVPKEFWTRANAELKKMKNVFMLAEANEPWLHEAGFDASYAWDEFAMMKKIAKGVRTPLSLDTIFSKQDTSYPKNAMRLFFTSNHDENSWNKADWQTMPGASHAPFAVLTQTANRSVPLIYSGQEEPFLDSLRFFYKDTITFEKYQRAPFYKTLLNLRKNNPALAADASFKKLQTNNDNALYAYEREKNGNKILVILNLSSKAQNFTWKTMPSAVEWDNIFLGQKEPVDKGFGIEPWGYVVYQLIK
jgi:alpha-amylase